jgi:hypothetical protein
MRKIIGSATLALALIGCSSSPKSLSSVPARVPSPQPVSLKKQPLLAGSHTVFVFGENGEAIAVRTSIGQVRHKIINGIVHILFLDKESRVPTIVKLSGQVLEIVVTQRELTALEIERVLQAAKRPAYSKSPPPMPGIGETSAVSF